MDIVVVFVDFKLVAHAVDLKAPLVDAVDVAAHRCAQHVEVVFVFGKIVVAERHIPQMPVPVRNEQGYEYGTKVRQHCAQTGCVFKCIEMSDAPICKRSESLVPQKKSRYIWFSVARSEERGRSRCRHPSPPSAWEPRPGDRQDW